MDLSKQNLPLRRFLQRAIETPLSRKLISGEIGDYTRVTVDFKKGELVFETSQIPKGRTAP
jgi:ATP-dependent Clp protease ATP-binding subunit ClpB